MFVNTGSGRGRGRSPMRLTRTLRGDGVLIAERRKVPVAYTIDIFNEGDHRTATGSLEGDFAAIARLKAARLRLADGVEIAIGLEVEDANNASVEISDPSGLAA